MGKLQGEVVRKASDDLRELTDIFRDWGKALYSGELPGERYTSYELGNLTRNSMEVVGKVSYGSLEHIYDDFSLCEFTREVLEKYNNV